MRLIAKSVLIASAVIAVGATPAAAGRSGEIQVNTGAGWTRDASTPLFDLDGIAPGWQQSRSFEVRNSSSVPTDITLESDDVVERENGCAHGEAQVDSTCRPDQGELGRALHFSVYVSSATRPAWSGSLYGLAAPVVISRSLPANGSETVRIAAELPWATGDEIETDSVGFDLRIHAQQDLTHVLGESVHRGNSGGAVVSGAGLPSTGHLAMTGFDLLMELLAASACLGAGWLLVLLARSRRLGGFSARRLDSQRVRAGGGSGV